LVIDNRGRMDEGCIGDLTTLEAQVSGLAGSWSGAHIATPPASRDRLSGFQLRRLALVRSA
jgi:hypothetical protein